MQCPEHNDAMAATASGHSLATYFDTNWFLEQHEYRQFYSKAVPRARLAQANYVNMLQEH